MTLARWAWPFSDLPGWKTTCRVSPSSATSHNLGLKTAPVRTSWVPTSSAQGANKPGFGAHWTDNMQSRLAEAAQQVHVTFFHAEALGRAARPAQPTS